MDVLLKRMGIHRGSFYGTFKSKRQVLIQSLRQYDASNRAALLREVAAGKSPRAAINTIFRSMIDGSRGPQGRHGCFLVNSALEIAPKDREAARIVRDGFQDVERFFAELVRRGQKAGEIRKGLHAARMGRTLMNQMIGLMVLVRSGAPRPALHSVAQQVDELLA